MRDDHYSGLAGGAVKRIAFDEEMICERGTSIAVHDYASALARTAGIHPIILFDEGKSVDRRAVARFADAFEVRPYRGLEGRRALMRALDVDLYYYLKLRSDDNRRFSNVPVATHIVFDLPPNPKGPNAYVSQWLSDFMTRGTVPVVPHIVTLPRADATAFRARHGIAEDQVLIGRHGGLETFDLAFVHRSIEAALAQRPDLTFAFVNTQRFTDHPRALFLPALYSRQATSEFIAGCDAMIHGRRRGESFGLAMAEFLFHDRPVFCWGGGQDRNHLRLQPEARHVYWSRHGLNRLLSSASRARPGSLSQGPVSRYGEEAVSALFRSAFEGKSGAETPPLRHTEQIRRRLFNRLSGWRDRICMAA